ncbi:DM13 domain-containing protein [Exiguobacterium sp. s102]|uniref:DM13 domain-containing protein n=1 Tax=Exiguobacterium sp. s102 TaxID=2751212 RepID=UPI001BE5EE06|nr:DM13 domain-containing protein [Exiguobacterium sp. s102]
MKTITKILLSVVIVGILAISWRLVSPLLFDKAVDEGLPPTSSDVKTEEQTPDTEDETETTTPGTQEEELTFSGKFVDGEKNYKTSGTLKTIQADDGQYLRFEDFKTTNGPDLFVYLIQPGMEPKEGINLGALKGNTGNQNYAVPPDVDFTKYNTVVIWCRAFNADFGTAVVKTDNE